MSTLSPRPLLSTFIPSLNALLAALALPFTLDDPTDLTPSLLLAIFESLISARLPIPPSIRQSRTKDAQSRAMLVLLGVLECDILRGGTHSLATSNLDDSSLTGAGGVSVDGWVDEIGLGEVDPERLADGGWEETIFVGELLCWLARRRGILPRTKSSHRSSHTRSLYSNHHSYGDEGDSADFSTSLLLRPSPAQKTISPRPPSPSPSIPDTDPDASALSHITDVPRHPLVHSPEPSLSVSATTGTDLSIRARSVSSRTSVSNARDDSEQFEEVSQDTIQMYDPLQMMQDAEDDDDRPPMFRPHCIHELDDPSYIRALASSGEHVSEDDHEADDPPGDEGAQYNDDLYAPPTPTPRRFRVTGWIDPVDAATELSQFAASRARSRALRSAPSAGSGSSSGPAPSTSRGHVRTSDPHDAVSRSTSVVLSRSRPLPGSATPTSRTPRRVSPSPSPSPPPASSSKYRHLPSRRTPRNPTPTPPPSPPSPTCSDADADAPFDISFSTLNNTSTPAKPRSRASRRAQPPDPAQTNTNTVDTSGGVRARQLARSPSYTPSPPSFSVPGSLRSAGSGAGGGIGMGASTSTNTGMGKTTKTDPGWGSSLSAPDVATPSASTLGSMTRSKKTRQESVSPPRLSSQFLSSARGATAKSTPTSPPGSTAVTNALLTERARLLTELAALKRARALSGGGGGGGGAGPPTGTGMGLELELELGVGTGARTRGSSGRVVSRRVGVGV